MGEHIMRTDQERERVRQLTNERTQARQALELISNSLRFASGEERKRLYNQSGGGCKGAFAN